MKQKFRRFMAGFLALLTVFSTLLGNGSTAFAASKSANIAFWYASVKDSGEVSELKKGYDHGKILYSILDGNAAYCMNFGLSADGGQLMNSYDNPSTDLSAAQEKLLGYGNFGACRNRDVHHGIQSEARKGHELQGTVERELYAE